MIEVDSTWIEQCISALVLLNMMLGHPSMTSPVQKETAESLVSVLNQIVKHTYKPDTHFRIDSDRRHSLRSVRNRIVPSDQYTVVVLNAKTRESEFVSVDTGGIIFDDPAWAVFAADAISRGEMVAVPKAHSDQELRDRLSVLETAITNSQYRPENFFSEILGFEDQSGPSFSVLNVTGAQLSALRSRGVQSFGSPSPKFYLLFRPDALKTLP